ncbi:MAG: methylmalonyl-CoA mutase, partial [Myxococcales bacterium]|nr:methylmalonyl-CoA mutase [Myxococcales bacterium]
KIFGGGGGTILPSEIEELHAYGIDRIYSPDDGRSLGLQGMIDDVMRQCDFAVGKPSDAEPLLGQVKSDKPAVLARLISLVENYPEETQALQDSLSAKSEAIKTPVLGITGTGGAGKSSLVDELVRRFLLDQPDKRLAIISVDPSKRKSGGALLGDRIRMNSIHDDRIYMRSLATRQSNLALSRYVKHSIQLAKLAGFDLVIVETSGIGQSDTEITEHSDVALYVMTAEYGAATQLEKIDMLDFADVIAINKFDKRGSLDALRDVRRQYKRNHQLFQASDDELPIFGSIASQFNDPGTNQLYQRLMQTIAEKTGANALGPQRELSAAESEKRYVIPPERVRYLAEICDSSKAYDEFVDTQAGYASALYQLHGALGLFGSTNGAPPPQNKREVGALVPDLKSEEGDATRKA